MIFFKNSNVYLAMSVLMTMQMLLSWHKNLTAVLKVLVVRKMKIFWIARVS
jgi:hypothetical protein